MMMRTVFAALFLVPALAFSLAFADTLMTKEGDALPAFQLNDQHDKPFPVPADTRAILFTADKSAGDMINGFLKQQAADYMTQRKIVYIADISAMPGFITSMVALPKMRDYTYRIAIGAEKEQTQMLPRNVDSVTLIEIKTGKIASIKQFKETEAGQLATALNALSATP
jgi:hypothetical protein